MSKWWKHTEASDRVLLGFEGFASRCAALVEGETSLLHPPNPDMVNCSVSVAEMHTNMCSLHRLDNIYLKPHESRIENICVLYLLDRIWPLCQWHLWCIGGWGAACAHTPADQGGTALSPFCCASPNSERLQIQAPPSQPTHTKFWFTHTHKVHSG